MSFDPRQQISILIFSTALSAFSLFALLNFTNPYTASWTIFGFLYLSVFLFAFSVLGLLGFALKRFVWPQIYVNDLSLALRQAGLIALFLLATVALQLNGILFWWLELCLILFFVALEFFINLKK